MHHEILRALDTALQLGLAARGSTSPNPPVGAVILSPQGLVVGQGMTQPPGGAHAEVMALAQAGDLAQGGTAVVTLEPCNHTGFTGPCTQALISAGIAEVYFLHSDPNPVASGGAEFLAAHGVKVTQFDSLDKNREDALQPWLGSVVLKRPHVTLKVAQTLDGFTAAKDGTSQWITGKQARDWAHRDRSMRDAIIIGTGTALADNPSLSARMSDGELYEKQPRRVVIGRRNLGCEPSKISNLRNLGFEQYPTVEETLQALWNTGARDVLVEGGSKLAYSFISKGLVDVIHSYVAPSLLGEGRSTLTGVLSTTISGASNWEFSRVLPLGKDILMELKPEIKENKPCSLG